MLQFGKMKYTITYYNDSVQQNILNLPKSLKAKYVALTDRMEEYGGDLGMPHTKPLSGGLFELRLKSADGIARVFFVRLFIVKLLCYILLLKKHKKHPKKN